MGEKEIYRQPMHGDEDRFMQFVDKLKSEKVLMRVDKLDPTFITAMIKLIKKERGVCLFAERDFEIQGFCNIIKQTNDWIL